MGKMYVLNDTGHAELAWRAEEPDEAASAGAEFIRLRQGGYVPFGKRRAGSEPVQVRDFDPHLEEIFWVRPITGG